MAMGIAVRSDADGYPGHPTVEAGVNLLTLITGHRLA